MVFLMLVLTISPILAMNPLSTQAQKDNNTLLSLNSSFMNNSDTLNDTKQNQYTKTFETRMGNLSTQFGYVTSETAKKLNDELFFQTAVQVYLLALPAVGGAGIFNGIDKVGYNDTDILYWSEPMTSDFEMLTPNTSTMYLFIPVDLQAGPIVFKAPPAFKGQ